MVLTQPSGSEKALTQPSGSRKVLTQPSRRVNELGVVAGSHVHWKLLTDSLPFALLEKNALVMDFVPISYSEVDFVPIRYFEVLCSSVCRFLCWNSFAVWAHFDSRFLCPFEAPRSVPHWIRREGEIRPKWLPFSFRKSNHSKRCFASLSPGCTALEFIDYSICSIQWLQNVPVEYKGISMATHYP